MTAWRIWGCGAINALAGKRMVDMGHFEKGKWVPDGFERLALAMIELGDAAKHFRWNAEKFCIAFDEAVNFQAGYFEKGKWVPLLDEL